MLHPLLSSRKIFYSLPKHKKNAMTGKGNFRPETETSKTCLLHVCVDKLREGYAAKPHKLTINDEQESWPAPVSLLQRGEEESLGQPPKNVVKSSIG